MCLLPGAYLVALGPSYIPRFATVERRSAADLTIAMVVESAVGRAKVDCGSKGDHSRPARRSLQVAQLMAAVDEIVVVGKSICSGRAKISVQAKAWCCSRETAV